MTEFSVKIRFTSQRVKILTVKENKFMNYKLKRTLFSLALVCLSLPLTVAAQTPGTLDTTFGGGGKVITESPAFLPMSEARGVAVQSDGKIVVTGYAGSNNSADFLTVRYNADGSLDTGFGAAGRVITNLSSFDNANAVAIQPDGKIVIAGRTVVNSSFVFAVVRYNANGTLDTSFGTGGSVTTDFNVYNEVNSIALQPDGKIIAFGEASQQQGNLTGSFLMVRYNTNGSLDSTFGTGGKVGTAFGINGARGYDVALQPDGKIVGFGITRQSSPSFQGIFGVVRYNSNGTLDTSFNGTGRATILFENNEAQFGKIALQPDGKIVLASTVRSTLVNELNLSRVAVARLLPNGALDTSFDLDGKVTTRIGATINGVAFDGLGNDVAIQTNGKILVAGYAQTGFQDGGDFALVRYNSDGSIDTGFGTNGITYTNFGPVTSSNNTDRAFSIVLQSNGKIVLAGASSANPTNQFWFAVARYNGDPVTPVIVRRAPVDFNGDGKTDFALGGLQRPGDNIPNPAQLVWYIQPNTYPLAPPTSTTDPNYFYRSSFGIFNGFNNPASDVPVPEDFDGDGKADIAVWRAGTNGSASYFYVMQSSTNSFVAYQFGQAGDNPRVSGDYDGDGKADFAVFRPAQSVNASDPCGAVNQGGTATGGFYYRPSASPNTVYLARCFGTSDALPIKGDFNGDGKLDFTVQLQDDAGNAGYFINYSSTSVATIDNVLVFGYNTDAVMPGDFDGDGKTDIAVLRPTGFNSTDNYKISVISATGTVLFSNSVTAISAIFPPRAIITATAKPTSLFTAKAPAHFTCILPAYPKRRLIINFDSARTAICRLAFIMFSTAYFHKRRA
jgi:uncharacterized delta-60 repeat protein